MEDVERRHAGIDVPVRHRPAFLVAIGPALVGQGVTLEIPRLVRKTHDEHRRREHVGPAELAATGLGPERVPVALRLVATFEHEERPALAESRGWRPLRVREHALDDRVFDRTSLEAADHLPFAQDVLELHQALRYRPLARVSNPASTR